MRQEKLIVEIVWGFMNATIVLVKAGKSKSSIVWARRHLVWNPSVLEATNAFCHVSSLMSTYISEFKIR